MSRSVINIEETIGKTVGRRRPPVDPLVAGFEHQAEMNRWIEAFGHRLGPRGVFRFHTHKEADAWTRKMFRPNRVKS